MISWSKVIGGTIFHEDETLLEKDRRIHLRRLPRVSPATSPKDDTLAHCCNSVLNARNRSRYAGSGFLKGSRPDTPPSLSLRAGALRSSI